MIIKEVLENGLIHTYSDNGHYLIQVETGIEYGDAIDKIDHEYVESENLIEE